MKTRSKQKALKVTVLPITRPRVENGVDWGVRRFVLARIGKKELILTPGHSAYADRITGNEWQPATLNLYDYSVKNYPYDEHRLLEGGRFTQTRLESVAALIDKFFNAPVTELVDPKRRWTVVPVGYKNEQKSPGLADALKAMPAYQGLKKPEEKTPTTDKDPKRLWLRCSFQNGGVFAIVLIEDPPFDGWPTPGARAHHDFDRKWSAGEEKLGLRHKSALRLSVSARDNESLTECFARAATEAHRWAKKHGYSGFFQVPPRKKR